MKEKKSVLETIENNYDTLFKREKIVADYIKQHPEKVVMMNVSEIANECKVSVATIVRMCQHIGFDGYHEMRLLLSRDVGREDESQNSSNQADFIDHALNESINGLKELGNKIDKKALIDSAHLIVNANSVYLAAIGNTTPVAADLEFRLARFGIKAYTSNMREVFFNYIGLGSENDILIAISNSGEAKRVIQAANLAKEIGMKVIVIPAVETTSLAQLADYFLLAGNRNVLFDSLREPNSHVGEIMISDMLLYMVKLLTNTPEHKVKDLYLDMVSDITSSEKM